MFGADFVCSHPSLYAVCFYIQPTKEGNILRSTNEIVINLFEFSKSSLIYEAVGMKEIWEKPQKSVVYKSPDYHAGDFIQQVH